jgi:hypothetical protein
MLAAAPQCHHEIALDHWPRRGRFCSWPLVDIFAKPKSERGTESASRASGSNGDEPRQFCLQPDRLNSEPANDNRSGQFERLARNANSNHVRPQCLTIFLQPQLKGSMQRSESLWIDRAKSKQVWAGRNEHACSTSCGHHGIDRDRMEEHKWRLKMGRIIAKAAVRVIALTFIMSHAHAGEI